MTKHVEVGFFLFVKDEETGQELFYTTADGRGSRWTTDLNNATAFASQAHAGNYAQQNHFFGDDVLVGARRLEVEPRIPVEFNLVRDQAKVFRRDGRVEALG